MNFIQIALLAALALFLFYFRHFRSRASDRWIFSIFALFGAIAITMPEYTSKVARWMGVGRGADLLLYGYVVFSGFLFLAIHARLRALQLALTEVTRELAKLQANRKDNSKSLGSSQ